MTDKRPDLSCASRREACTYDRADCVRPWAKRKYEKKPYVCHCGYEHLAVRDSSNWAGNGWEWEHPRR